MGMKAALCALGAVVVAGLSACGPRTNSTPAVAPAASADAASPVASPAAVAPAAVPALALGEYPALSKEDADEVKANLIAIQRIASSLQIEASPTFDAPMQWMLLYDGPFNGVVREIKSSDGKVVSRIPDNDTADAFQMLCNVYLSLPADLQKSDAINLCLGTLPLPSTLPDRLPAEGFSLAEVLVTPEGSRMALEVARSVRDNPRGGLRPVTP